MVKKTVEYISSKDNLDRISLTLLEGAIVLLILDYEFFIFVENQEIGSVFFYYFFLSQKQ